MLGLSLEGQLLLLELELQPAVAGVRLLHVWLSVGGLRHRDVAQVALGGVQRLCNRNWQLEFVLIVRHFREVVIWQSHSVLLALSQTCRLGHLIVHERVSRLLGGCRLDIVDLVDPDKGVRLVVIEVVGSGEVVFSCNLASVECIALSDEIKRFVWLNHQLLVSLCQVLGLDHDRVLLLELDIAACGDDDSVLAGVVLVAAFLALHDLLFDLEVLERLFLELWEVEGIDFVRSCSNLDVDELEQLLCSVVELLLGLDFLLERDGDVLDSLREPRLLFQALLLAHKLILDVLEHALFGLELLFVHE